MHTKIKNTFNLIKRYPTKDKGNIQSSTCKDHMTGAQRFES